MRDTKSAEGCSDTEVEASDAAEEGCDSELAGTCSHIGPPNEWGARSVQATGPSGVVGYLVKPKKAGPEIVLYPVISSAAAVRLR